MKKQKLLDEEKSILLIESTSIKASPDANKNRADQENALSVQKVG